MDDGLQYTHQPTTLYGAQDAEDEVDVSADAAGDEQEEQEERARKRPRPDGGEGSFFPDWCNDDELQLLFEVGAASGAATMGQAACSYDWEDTRRTLVSVPD